MTTPARSLAFATCLSLALGAVASARAAETEPVDLSLEELLKADVQTASRKSQPLQEVAAAVFVITRDDIERSGATSIPEVLRMAPGVEVARISSSHWGVSVRGFNGRFANKLLVLMDGRSIYSPLFSGVVWEAQDTLLEDIERIEVIRGPGASLWGANAVNGVINIITRKARDTTGNLAAATIGTEDRGIVALRHGLPLGDGNLRVWGKALARDTSVDSAGNPGQDYWRESRLGFRGDWSLDTTRRITLSGTTYSGRTGDKYLLPSVAAADGTAPTDVTQNTSGSHLLARHEWLWSDGSEAALQGYADSSDLEVVGVVREKRTTIDLDFQNRPHFGGRHDVVWGLGYRESHFNIGSGTIVSIAPDHGVWRLASAFVQDEITLAPDSLRLVLGTRFEHNSLTGFEPQPNLRLIWTPTSQQSVWGALSRAVRTPSVAERGAQIDLNVIPPGQAPFPTLVRNVADTGHPLGDEVVKALELGFRQQFDNQLSLDLALFHNRYDQLRAGTQGAFGVEVLPVLHGVQAISTNNAVNARTRGVELALDWRPTPRWRLQPAYSYIRIDARAANADPIASGAAAEYNSSAPRHQFSLRASTTLTDRSQFDAWLRRIGTLPAANPGDTAIAAYTTLDLRYAWRLRQGLDLSVVGQNLLEKKHAEIVPELLPSQSLQMQRAVLLKMKWQF